MTNLKSILFIALIIISNTLAAQKFGHVNSLELLQSMPDVANAEKSLEEFGNKLKTQIQNMYMEYQNKVTAYQQDEAGLSDGMKEVRLNEIQDIQQRVGLAEQSAQQDLLKEKERIYAPILKSVEDAINAVAEENKYTYIFDTSSGSVLYAADSDDVVSLVKKKLNIN